MELSMVVLALLSLLIQVLSLLSPFIHTSSDIQHSIITTGTCSIEE